MTNKIELSIYGTRGSCATGSKEYMEFGGDTSSYALRHGDTLQFLDAGTGIRRAMAKELTPDLKKVYLNITHGHADHIDMGCAGALYFNNIPGGIHVFGYRDVARALGKFFDGDTTWPIPLDGLKGLNPEMTGIDGGESFQHLGYRVSTLRNYHPSKGLGGSVGFRFDIDKEPGSLEKVAVAYVTDMEFDYMPGVKLQPQAEELKKEFVKFVHGADILLADTHFTREEYEKIMPFVRGWGHSPLEQVIDLANQAGVRSLVGTHHAPQHTDDLLTRIENNGREYARANGFRGDFRLARDGDRYTL